MDGWCQCGKKMRQDDDRKTGFDGPEPSIAGRIRRESFMIKTIIFDIGNVLMRFDYDVYIKNLLKDDDLIEKVNEAIWARGYWNELDLGYDPETVFSKMYEAGPDYQEEIRLVLDHVGQCIGPAEYAKPWIRDLKKKGYRILYLSNYSEYIMEAGPEALNFLPLMDGGVFSCYVGMIKPDPAIYEEICDKYALKPSECVFIDDNKENIKAAKTFGLHVVHFKDYEQAKGELSDLLFAFNEESEAKGSMG